VIKSKNPNEARIAGTSESDMFRVVLACDGVPAAEGVEAAIDIQNEFKEFRGPRYINPSCVFEDGRLILSCDNDGWDSDGLALMDEFSDCIPAYISSPFDGDLKLVSATVV
jgi:hypothetical protein